MAVIECPEVVVSNRDLAVTLPGAVRIQVQFPGIDPSQLQVALQMLAQTSGAIAPLTPIFDLIGMVLALKDFADTFTSFPPNPADLAAAIDAIIEKAAALLQLIPQLSVPLMVLGLIDAILALLNAMIEELRVIIDMEADIAAVQVIVDETGNTALVEAISCAQSLLGVRQSNLEEAMGPADVFINLINSFMSLIPGLPTIPTVGDLPEDASDAVDYLESLVQTIQGIRDLIPV